MEIEKGQDSLKEQLTSLIRTELIKEENMHFSCVLLLTNEQNGRLDIIAQGGDSQLIDRVKGVLQAGVDQLNRIQLRNALICPTPKKEE